MEFDHIPYEDVKFGAILGSGSFGRVYKEGDYLGIDIALKEILPSQDYNVEKYFQREFRIMRECRHPNIVLYLGLSYSTPSPTTRQPACTYIVSEFVPGGNLRSFLIHASRGQREFPWRLRLSFATDIARAVAYLHARKCIHRDLKGENLLITANERVKVTDFGFARIAARNDDEMKRMSYCGTDGYMSPEILMGLDFDERTDVFSLGVILAEILSCTLVQSERVFARTAPLFTLDANEVISRASPGCPPALIALALACSSHHAHDRPSMPAVLAKLREIELDVMSRQEGRGGASEHVGSIKVLPSVRGRQGKGLESLFRDGLDNRVEVDAVDEEQVLAALEAALKTPPASSAAVPMEEGTIYRTARWEDPESATKPDARPSAMSIFEAPAVTEPSAHFPGHYQAEQLEVPSPFEADGSTMTVRAGDDRRSASPSAFKSMSDGFDAPLPAIEIAAAGQPDIATTPAPVSPFSPTEWTPRKLERAPTVQFGTHRFSLVGKRMSLAADGDKAKKGSARIASLFFGFTAPATSATAATPDRKTTDVTSTVAESRCPVCTKRIGKRPSMRCDDCGVFVHVKCSHRAVRDCVI